MKFLFRIVMIGFAAVLAVSAADAPQGARLIRENGYDRCIELSNGETRVVLDPNLGGRVLRYQLKGVEALFQDPAQDGVTYEPGRHVEPSAGRFDIGPETTLPRHPTLYLGSWSGEITGDRAARLTSQRDPALDLILTREFKLAAQGSHLVCTQTIRNLGRESRRVFHWSRTLAAPDGICFVPLNSRSRYPQGYAVYVPGSRSGRVGAAIDFRPEPEPNIRVREGLLEFLGPPTNPKYAIDADAGWIAYLTRNHLLFVKKFPVYPDRAYGEIAANSACIYYHEKFCELEPIGPVEELAPGQSASFTEEWWLHEFAFPEDRQPQSRCRARARRGLRGARHGLPGTGGEEIARGQKSPMTQPDYASEIIARPDDPYPVYDALRASGRVYFSPTWKCWVLSHYQDIAAVLLNPEVFSSRGRVTNVIQREFPEHFLEQIKPLLHHYSRGVINLDPPDHTRMRRLLQKTFLPRTLDRLKAEIRATAHELLEAAQARGHVDVVADLAYPLPVTVIASLLGVPRADREKFKRWSAIIMEFQAVPLPTADAILRSQAGIVELRNYLREVAAERRKNPREDVISELVTLELHGDRLAEDELLSTCVTLLVAGHETTTNLIASATWLLLRHPKQLARLRADPALMPPAIEEVLRFESPLHRVGRTALSDFQIAGTEIRKGETVFLMLAAANRDPAQFPEPDSFDIARSPNKHIAFGYGIHFCLGAALARLEAPIALEALFERWPDARLTDNGEPLPWHSGVMRGLKRLPLQLR